MAMGGRTGCVILFVALVAWAPAAPARSEQRCTTANATATSIEAIQADYSIWAGRCVRVRGLGIDSHLYVDRQALTDDDTPLGEDARRSIIMLPDRQAPRLRRNRPMMVDVIGRIGSCRAAHDVVAEMSADQPDRIIMISGYCHTSLATYIAPSAIRPIDTTRPVRLTEAKVPAERRGIIEAPVHSNKLPAMRSAAHALFAALATRDEAAFLHLSEPDGIAPRQQKDARRKFSRLIAPRSAFAKIPPAHHPERIFVERLDAAEADPSQAIVCRCRTSDCAGKWPVVMRDADNLPDRPYVCVHANDYLLGPGRDTVIQVTAEQALDGFAEPLSYPARKD